MAAADSHDPVPARAGRRLRRPDAPGAVEAIETESEISGTSDRRRAPKRRGIVNRQVGRPGPFLKLRGILDQPTLWVYAATIPQKSAEGAPRKLPDIVYLSMPSLAAIWGSFSKAETTLGEPETWRVFCQTLCDLQARFRPQDEPFDLEQLLATAPLTAQNFYDARRSWLAPHLETLEAMFTEHAADAALELGYADEKGPGSCINLTRSRTLAGDGKVTREPRSRYLTLLKAEENPALGITATTHVIEKATGEILSARDMDGDAHLHITGSGPVVGYKTVRLALRNYQTNDTIIVAVKRPSTADEASCAVDAALAVKRRLPGVLGVTYDTALRGTHIRRLAKEGGLVVAAPVAAKSVDKATNRRTEKSGYLTNVSHTRPDGLPCQHNFSHQGGRLHEVSLDSHGKKTLAPCRDPFVHIRPNKSSFRMYLEWQIRCSAGLAPGTKPTVVETLSWNITDDRRDFNVAENLRALPPGK